MNRDMFCMLSDLLSFISFFNIEVDGLFQNLLSTYFFSFIFKVVADKYVMIFITYIFTAVMAQTHTGRDVLLASPFNRQTVIATPEFC